MSDFKFPVVRTLGQLVESEMLEGLVLFFDLGVIDFDW